MLVHASWHFNEQTNPITQRIVHGTTIEIIRTIFPSTIPLFIAIPLFALCILNGWAISNPLLSKLLDINDIRVHLLTRVIYVQ